MSNKLKARLYDADHTGRGWWLDICTDFDCIPEMADTSDFLLYFDNKFVCLIGSSGTADKLVPLLVEELNNKKIRINYA